MYLRVGEVVHTMKEEHLQLVVSTTFLYVLQLYALYYSTYSCAVMVNSRISRMVPLLFSVLLYAHHTNPYKYREKQILATSTPSPICVARGKIHDGIQPERCPSP